MPPRVPFMLGQLCVALCVADGAGEGVTAVLADPALTAVVAAPVRVAGEWCVVDALAIAMLPPNPAPSTPAPIAVPTMIVPSLDFTVSASSRSG